MRFARAPHGKDHGLGNSLAGVVARRLLKLQRFLWPTLMQNSIRSFHIESCRWPRVDPHDDSFLQHSVGVLEVHVVTNLERNLEY